MAGRGSSGGDGGRSGGTGAGRGRRVGAPVAGRRRPGVARATVGTSRQGGGTSAARRTERPPEPRRNTGRPSSSRGRPPARRPARRRSWWGRLTRRGRRLVVGSVAVVALFVLLFAGGMGVAGWLDSSVKMGNLLGSARSGHAADVKGPLNFLVVGSNFRTDDPSNGERADTLMIVHVTKDLRHAFLVSVPRDLYVTIQPDEKAAPNYKGSTEKIDAALNYGGMPLQSEAVSDLTGVRFDGAVEARFQGFEKAVQDLGGVDMYVDEETTSVHVGWDAKGRETKPYGNTGGHPYPLAGITPQVYHVGYQHLKPWQALDYVRQRELLPGGDYDRQRHQQQFIAAVLRQTASAGTMSDPVKLDRTVRDIGSAVTADTNGTSVSDLAWALHNITSKQLVGLRPPSHPVQINGSDYVQGDTGMDDLWRDIRGDHLSDWASKHPQSVNQLEPTQPANS